MNRFQPFSALILSGLKARQDVCNGAPGTPGKGGSYSVVYQCDNCEEVHDFESDAEECCSDEGTLGASSQCCPVCGEDGGDYRDAADCCLWKDLAAPARWRIADAVEAGSTWQEAIEQETGQSIN